MGMCLSSTATRFIRTSSAAPNSGANGYTYSPIQANKFNQYIGRFDFSPTQKNQFYFVGIHEVSPLVWD